MHKKLLTICLAAAILMPMPSLAAVSLKRSSPSKVVHGPISVNFSFDDWQKDMNFVDIFGREQNYWWIEVGSATNAYSSECFSSDMKSANPEFNLPPGDYLSVSVNAAATLEDCKNIFGGQRYAETGAPLFRVISPHGGKFGQLGNGFHS